jgi:hypothetical protein
LGCKCKGAGLDGLPHSRRGGSLRTTFTAREVMISPIFNLTCTPSVVCVLWGFAVLLSRSIYRTASESSIIPTICGNLPTVPLFIVFGLLFVVFARLLLHVELTS